MENDCKFCVHYKFDCDEIEKRFEEKTPETCKEYEPLGTTFYTIGY